MNYATYEGVVKPDDVGGLYDFDSVYDSKYTGMIYETAGINPDIEISGVKFNAPKERNINFENINPIPSEGAKSGSKKRFEDEPEQKFQESVFTIKNSSGLSEFEKAYDNVEKVMPEAKKYRKILTSIASHESSFNSSSKNPYAPAYGYFQFMQDGKKYNNITAYSGLTTNEFLSNPEEQIKAAVKMAKDIESQINENDSNRAQKLGITMNAMIGGAWLGGVGGLRKFLHNGINLSDSGWYKNKNGGIDMATQIKRYNF